MEAGVFDSALLSSSSSGADELSRPAVPACVGFQHRSAPCLETQWGSSSAVVVVVVVDVEGGGGIHLVEPL